MLSTLSVILVLGGLIFFHELGHFSVARLFGIGVKTFSLGFGPKLAGFTSGLTEYRLSVIPLGGYVQLVAQDPGEEAPAEFPPETHFILRPAWQRMLVVAAGPIFNFVLAWLIFFVLLLANGKMELLPIVGEVRDNSPALSAGLKSGDRILAIDDTDVSYWRDMSTIIRSSQGPITLTIDREGDVFSKKIEPKVETIKNLFGEEEHVALIGVTSAGKTVTIPQNPGNAIVGALNQTWDIIALTAEGILKLFTRVVPLDSVGGPIMIAQMVSQQANEGLFNVLALMAVISVNLGLLNLLPIPVLDGGHILFYTLETAFRKPVSEKLQRITTHVGLAFLLGLMALAIFNDIQRILL
ncbi:RIP metalloprotease RseP [Desulfovibrio inopinatus]|uniref:RIP metalloprotease RseP n=1 Tax=Desulfovibrio inopinatus TaxID=102109 RepID=UPI0004887BC8|nr:RIP metalloprotease RseP [Desulfovibrio inopinatus]